MAGLKEFIDMQLKRRNEWASWASREPTGSKHGATLADRIVVLDLVIQDAKNLQAKERALTAVTIGG